MKLCAACSHDQDDHQWGEAWCTTTRVLGQDGQLCDCPEFIDPDDVEECTEP